MTPVRLVNIDKYFPDRSSSTPVAALRDVSLDIAAGEFFVLLGPSGCGKTTLLRIIAGLEQPTRGRVFLGDRDVTRLDPSVRGIAMVFQDYALYPHMNVYWNLGFGLRNLRTPQPELDRRVREVASLLGLTDLLQRRPKELSGGQRQRVALGRALVRNPQVFLFDEPLSNLDAKIRADVRDDLARLHAALGATSIYVTHDQLEAMSLGSRIAVLNHGSVEQVGTPEEIYTTPATRFVAGFIGSPQMNFFDVALAPGRDRLLVHDTGASFQLANAQPHDVPLPPGGGLVELGIRPEDFRVGTPPDTVAVLTTQAVIRRTEMLGLFQILHCVFSQDTSREFRVVINERTKFPTGERVDVFCPLQHTHWFDKDNGARIRPAAAASAPSPPAAATGLSGERA